MYKVTILGAGYVGLPTGAHFSRVHEVTIYDPDKTKINTLWDVMEGKSDDLYIYENNLLELIRENKSNLTITNDLKEALKEPDIIFIAVGTPPDKQKKANLTFVCQVAKQIATHITKNVIVLNKSTVPPGTAYLVQDIIDQNLIIKNLNIIVGSCPEFLAEGTAIEDLRTPNRIVFGIDDKEAREKIKNFFLIFHAKNTIVPMSTLSSELTKYASNAMLATRISFMNSLAVLCDKLGANIKEIQEGIGKDERIGGKFLHASMGYGGSCFPKDTMAISGFAHLFESPLKLIDATVEVNEDVFQFFYKKILQDHNNKIDNIHFIIWGLGFKSRTDDIRESKAVKLIQHLILEGVHLHIYDPIRGAVKNFETQNSHLKGKYTTYDNPYACFENVNASGFILGNEDERFRNPKIDILNKLKEKYVYDSKNALSAQLVQQLNENGFIYRSVGRDALTNNNNKKAALVKFLKEKYMG